MPDGIACSGVGKQRLKIGHTWPTNAHTRMTFSADGAFVAAANDDEILL